VQSPSPSNPKSGAPDDDNGILGTDEDELLTMPTRVSSPPSYGPMLPSAKTNDVPSGLMTINSPQLESAPIGGHCLKGGVGTTLAPGAAALAAAAETGLGAWDVVVDDDEAPAVVDVVAAFGNVTFVDGVAAPDVVGVVEGGNVGVDGHVTPGGSVTPGGRDGVVDCDGGAGTPKAGDAPNNRASATATNKPTCVRRTTTPVIGCGEQPTHFPLPSCKWWAKGYDRTLNPNAQRNAERRLGPPAQIPPAPHPLNHGPARQAPSPASHR
jgi:hypothetical protein